MKKLQEVLNHINSAKENLNAAAELLSASDKLDNKDNIRSLCKVFRYLGEVENRIYILEPSLEPISYIEPDGEPTEEDYEIINCLTAEQLFEIDALILGFAGKQYRKVAMIVAMTMSALDERFSGIPDVFFSSRIKRLVKLKKLESEGNLDYMRYSEVRLPSSD